MRDQGPNRPERTPGELNDLTVWMRDRGLNRPKRTPGQLGYSFPLCSE